jgi:hypothetical protein
MVNLKAAAALMQVRRGQASNQALRLAASAQYDEVALSVVNADLR